MAGYKTWAAGEEVLAADLNSYLQSQIVARFPNASTRTAQLTAPVLNQLSELDSAPGNIDYWNGTAWVPTPGVSRELAYAQITANKNVSATAEATADLVVAAPAVTFDGTTPVIAEFFSPAVIPATIVAASVHLRLYQDGTSVGELGIVSNPAAGQFYVPVFATRRFTPPAGSHTYTIGATRDLGNGVVAAGPGASGGLVPAYIRIAKA